MAMAGELKLSVTCSWNLLLQASHPNIYSSNVTQDRLARNLVMWSLTISQPGGKKEASAG